MARVRARAVGNAVFLDTPGGNPGEFGAWGMPGADGTGVVAAYLNDVLRAEQDAHRLFRDEVAAVLGRLDELAEVWGDEAVYRWCRDRLRAAVAEANRE